MMRSVTLVTPARNLTGTIPTIRLKSMNQKPEEVSHTGLETAQSQGSEQTWSRQGLQLLTATGQELYFL